MITYENGWRIYNVWWYWNEKHKFHHYKRPIFLTCRYIKFFPRDSGKELIKTKYQDNGFFERAILEVYFWESYFENVFFGEQFWKCFLREQFWKCIFWGNCFDKYLSWLLTEMTADWGGCWLAWVLNFHWKVLSTIKLTKKI